MVLPNGKEGHPVTCPKCGDSYEVQRPEPSFLGGVLTECHCGAVFEYDSPHGPRPVDVSTLESTEGRNAAGELVTEVSASETAASGEHNP